ncbi:MAG: hypothetical protein JXC32_18120 [Anaerolineae bacterium]|nr:hypothetical protein [Anaerolineae bacterium]
MTVETLRYDLVDGYINNWLIAGPQVLLASELEGGDAGAVKRALAKRYPKEVSGVTEAPVEYSRFVGHKATIDDYEGSWTYVHTLEDHFVDLSSVAPVSQVLRAWAYTQVDLPAAQDATLVLTTYGPADVWVNDRHVHHHDEGPHSRPRSVTFDVPFAEGNNAILVRFTQVAYGACTFAVALQIVAREPGAKGHPPKGAVVAIPTAILPVKRRRELERTFDAAHLNQIVYERFDRINVHFDPITGRWARGFALRLQTPDGQTYAESEVGPRPEKETDATLGQAYSYPDRYYHAVLAPTNEEYVHRQMWATRTLPFWGLDNSKYSDERYGQLVERRFEALKQAAAYPNDIYAEMAKMAISWWTVIEQPVISRVIERVSARSVGSVRELLGLLAILIRFSEDPAFPEDLRAPLEEVVLGYDYAGLGTDQGLDLSRDAEADTLLRYTCAILAGQRYPDRVFPTSGEVGAWHREEGERLALQWLRRRAGGGFAAWDSDSAYAEVIAALIHLVEFAEDQDLFELATALLDKTLFALALNSYKGVFGSTRGLTETGPVLHGMLEATSGISRLMWGMGSFNRQTMGYVSLACADTYGFPQLIQDIPAESPDELWSRERHVPGRVAGQPDDQADAVDKVMYRTPDYMLSSAQDYRPGEPGSREHIWRATLSPAATVFTNHPACSSFHEARRPNYWRGNGVLPRVAQWHDVVVAIYALPEDDWMGFTHAYFPTYAFDAYALREGWAFAQKGDGYLALTSARGLTLLETGMHAQRELRSYGKHNVWLCQMGRAAQDGTFQEFQEAVLRQVPVFDDLSVHTTTLRDETLSFGWEGDLLRNGEIQPLGGDRHYDSVYGVASLPAEEMIIVSGQRALRLHLG